MSEIDSSILRKLLSNGRGFHGSLYIGPEAVDLEVLEVPLTPEELARCDEIVASVEASA